jgi:hypothetical protein
MPKQAILYLSHVVNRTLRRAYGHLKRECAGVADVYFVLNLNDENVPPGAKGTFPITPAHRAALGLPSRTGIVGRNWWNDHDRALLAFRQLKPEYDYYWIMEYDVEFSGRWSELFNAFADNTSDLLCTSMHRPETNPNWGWWKSLVWPREPKPQPIRGFFPFARLSAQAIDTIIESGRNGVDGFYEVVWPTVIHDRGLVIEDIGGDGPFVRPANVNRWYTSTLTNDTLSPGTFVWKPVSFRHGQKPNTLWHPVKPQFIGYALSRLKLRISSS